MLTDVFLGLAVLAAWLGALAFIRLKAALDRLHCVSFVNVAGGAAIFAAALISDGATVRTLKIFILTAAVLLNGAALAHAIGRALALGGTTK
ncbi:MAG TPA: monovalent cation/H(+) antiporter subunit G [Stellaceae bacterium]|nr:monovalent cation/H(+) antiporter subunit G [Stellaceae bacterium]